MNNPNVKAKPTPGPWTLTDKYAGPIAVLDASDEVVARVYGSVHAAENPDARLIAAAPELLAMLQDVERALNVGFFSDTNRETHLNYMSEITKLIAKATGGAK